MDFGMNLILIEFDDAKLIAENYWFDKLVDLENIKNAKT